MSSPPRVAFDVTPVISGATGIARYVTQLDVALSDQGVELRRFAIGRSSFPVPPGTRHLRVPARIAVGWWRAVSWPYIEQAAGRADLVHATGLLMPSTRLPLVITVHDLTVLRHPELLPDRQVRQQQALVRTLDRAAAVVAVSRATAEDVAGVGVAAERVVIAPLGLTPLAEPAPLPEALRPRGEYLLTVGETAPRKGYTVLLQALSRLRRDVELVMVGPPGADEQRIQRVASELGLAPRVRRLGTVTQGALATLYEGALAVCFPSVAEGFGLPVLEAMAAGTPALVSDLPVMREVAGSAAVYLDHQQAGQWAEAIEALISSPGQRKRMARAGRERAAHFTWNRTAAETLGAYRLALGTAVGGSV